MTDFDLDAVFLAGFTMAHAIWSVADTTDDELLVPLAIVERDGTRQILRFEAETQLEAIEAGKRTMAEQASALDAWAFARENAWRRQASDDVTSDVVTVEFSARSMALPGFVVQEFSRLQPAQAFRVIAPPVFIRDSAVVEAPLHLVRETLIAGIQSHAHAGPLWREWSSAVH